MIEQADQDIEKTEGNPPRSGEDMRMPPRDASS